MNQCCDDGWNSSGLVLGNVGQPEPVRSIRGEMMTLTPVLVDDDAEVVVNGRTGILAVLAPRLPEYTDPAVC